MNASGGRNPEIDIDGLLEDSGAALDDTKIELDMTLSLPQKHGSNRD